MPHSINSVMLFVQKSLLTAGKHGFPNMLILKVAYQECDNGKYKT